MMKKQVFILILNLFICSVYADSSYIIKVHFLYGSKPAKEFRGEEKRWFGGLHGGHVSIELGNSNVSFNPYGKQHIFPHKKNKHGKYYESSLSSWKRDSVKLQFTSFIIPVTKAQYDKIDSIQKAYLKETPYDYSFFGFRCASATWDVLEQAGILEEHTDLWKAWVIFYPRRIRKRMFKLAEKSNWEVVRKKGYEKRVWEKDK